MHDTALIAGRLFAMCYGGYGKTVIDIGGRDVNGSLRSFFESNGMKYICVDIEEHQSVDVVTAPGAKLPFDDQSVDLIVSTSCFEHDPCFWITFKDMTRIVKMGGFIYVNAPSNGPYHCFPGDNWRFYSDAGQSLSYWSSFQYSGEPIFPVSVVETFHLLPLTDVWVDFVCIWQRVNEVQTSILTSPTLQNGPLETSLQAHNCQTVRKISGTR